jgi:hypothetical protein
MEPVSAFGLAVNTMQVGEYVGKVIKTANLLLQSMDGTLESNDEIEAVARDLEQLTRITSATMSPDDDESLRLLCDLSQNLANRLVVLMNKIKIPNRGNTIKVFLKAVQTLSVESEAKKIQQRVATLQAQIITHGSLKSQ